MRISMLGTLEVEGDAGPIEVGGFRVRTLLALLALEAGRTVTAERLIDALWPDDPPANSANALQTLVRRLRAALRPLEVLESRPGGYALAIPADQVDVLRFDGLAASDPEAALSLWRGPALADLSSVAHLVNVAARLEEERLATVEALAARRLTAGQPFSAEPVDLLAEVAAHPLRERLAALTMRALAADGRQADALALYERTRARLANELGVDPGADLRAAHLAVLKGEFPVRRSRPAGGLPSGNLRRPLTSFIGREDELDQLTDLLAVARMVTIVGPGGAGKTRLATEAALRLPRGWMVELASVTDPGAVTGAVLDALGLRDGPGRLGGEAWHTEDPLARVAEALGSQQAVLVLDNCEHLIGAAATLAERLLTCCPGLRVLATSREPLNVPGERLAPIPSLELPPVGASPESATAYPAVRLLLDRATAARPAFALDEANVEAVVSLCRKLDGMPLPIELAAARLRSMTPRQLADRLDDRFRLLTGGSRTALPRQQTLRAVVEWSWDLLGEDERTLMRRLGVFAGGATLEVVEEVCDGTPDVLGALVDKSLVQVSAGGRYSMLETIRAYALERLAESGEEEVYRRRHAVHLMELTERAVPELRTRAQLEWMERLSAERDDWTAALHWAADTGDVEVMLRLCGALIWFWWMCGYHQESARWAARTIELAGDTPPPGLVRAYTACTFAYAVSRFAEVVNDRPGMLLMSQRLDELVSAAEREGPVHPLLLISRIVMAGASGRDEYAAELVAGYAQADDPWLAASAWLIGPAGTRTEEGLERAVKGFRELGDRWGLTEGLLGLAFLRAARGEPTDELLEEAGSLTIDWVSPMERISTLTRLASLRTQAGDLDGAAADLRRAREFVEADLPVFSLIQLGLAECHLARERGDLDQARAGFGQLLGLVEQAPPIPQFIASVHTGYGRVLSDLGDVPGAREQHGTALRLLGDEPDRPVLSATLAGFALAELAGGDAERAAVLFGASGALDPPDQSADAVAGMASARRELGEERFEQAHGEGAALTREEVYELIGSTR